MTLWKPEETDCSWRWGPVVMGTAPPFTFNAESIDQALWAKHLPLVACNMYMGFLNRFSSIFLLCLCHIFVMPPSLSLNACSVGFPWLPPSFLFLRTQMKFTSRTVETQRNLVLSRSPPISHCCQWRAKNRAVHQAIIPTSVCIHTFFFHQSLLHSSTFTAIFHYPLGTLFNWLFSQKQL